MTYRIRGTQLQGRPILGAKWKNIGDPLPSLDDALVGLRKLYMGYNIPKDNPSRKHIGIRNIRPVI